MDLEEDETLRLYGRIMALEIFIREFFVGVLKADAHAVAKAGAAKESLLRQYADVSIPWFDPESGKKAHKHTMTSLAAFYDELIEALQLSLTGNKSLPDQSPGGTSEPGGQIH